MKRKPFFNKNIDRNSIDQIFIELMGKQGKSLKNYKIENNCQPVHPQATRKCFSTTKIISRKNNRSKNIANNIRHQLRQLLRKPNKDQRKHNLKSLLNLKSEHEICSAMNIPSIQNMVSMQELASFDRYSEYDSIVSFVESNEFLLLESEPDLMVSYLFLIQKVLKSLGQTLPSRQNEKIIKGIWNLLFKFWIDVPKEQQNMILYQGINQKIEWGLFQVLNFELKVNKRDLFIQQTKLTSLSHLK